MVVHDNEPGALTVILPASLSEAKGPAYQGRVEMNVVATEPVLVSLTSSDTTELFVTGSVTISAGQSAVLSMNGLPTGSDSFLGQAYGGLCSGVTASSIPTWSSDPTVVSLVPGTTASVSLKLSHNANANVTVDFVDDASAVGDGGTSPSPGPGLPG